MTASCLEPGMWALDTATGNDLVDPDDVKGEDVDGVLLPNVATAGGVVRPYVARIVNMPEHGASSQVILSR